MVTFGRSTDRVRFTIEEPFCYWQYGPREPVFSQYRRASTRTINPSHHTRHDDSGLARVRVDYNTVRLHEAIGYVTPDDEHYGRGQQIREARRHGLARARQNRLDHHRQHNHNNPEETP